MKEIISLLFCILLIGCTPLKTNIFDPIEYNQQQIKKEDKQYRTANSREAYLGSIGNIIYEEEPHSYELQKTHFIKDGDYLISTTFKSNVQQFSENVQKKLNLRINELFEYSGDTAYSANEKYVLAESMISDRQKLVGELRELMKEDPSFKEFLSDPKIRIITKIITLHDYSKAQDYAFTQKLQASLLNRIRLNGSMELADSKKDQLKYEVSPVVTYIYSRLCWDNNSGKLRQLITDNLNESEVCPHNSSFDHPGLKNANNTKLDN